MEFLNNIQDNSFLITSNEIKEKILDYIEENNLLLNVKFISFNDLKEGLLYSYTDEAIYHVMKTKGINYEVAKYYIDNTYYILEDNYDNKKMNDLLAIKRDLKDNNLLLNDNLFVDFLKSKTKLYVYGFDYINKFNKYLLNEASKYIEIEYIDKEQKDYKHYAYELDTINDEVYYVAENIAKLISEGIPLEKIYISNYSEEYYFTFNKIFKQYNIPFNVKTETSLYDTALGNYFIKNLNNELPTLLDEVINKFDVENNTSSSNAYKALIKVINKFYWTTDYTSIKELIIEEMRNEKIKNTHYLHEIKNTSIINNIFNDDEYVFLIGFNLGSIPKVKKDEDYITDDIKPDILEKTVETNTINKNTILGAIQNIKNLTITYKHISTFDNFYPSYLIDGNIITNKKIESNYSNYSEEYNKLIYADKIDKLIKFNEKNQLLRDLNNNYSIPYNTYNNNFSGVNIAKIQHELNSVRCFDNKTYPKYKFSYSNISSYYKCPFKFYIDTFYKLSEFEQSLDAFIGSLFHKVLEKCANTNEDIDKVYDEYIKTQKDKELTIKDKYFTEKLREECHFIVNTIREQYKHTSYSEELHEEPVVLESKDTDLNIEYNIVLKGLVDKYMINNNDIVIIDYKTGTSDKIDRKQFEFGLCLQLPIYLYLLKNKNKNYNIVGMYLQHILPSMPKRDKKSLEEIKTAGLKLDGLTLDDKDKIKDFDDSYDKSEVIRSLETKADGEFKYKTKVITYEEQDAIYKQIKELIENCITNVFEGKYEIKPIWIKNTVDACAWCSYKDICYRRKEQYDIKYIAKDSNGGDDNE